jgi:hypothetical protein
MQGPILISQVTCPHCGHEEAHQMPEDSCLFFLECPSCEALIKPLPGDCCVFCSYGTAPCPPIQRGETCGEGDDD